MRGMGRLYYVSFAAVAVTAQQDLIYIKPAADKPCLVEALKLAASGGAADAGDAQEELFDVQTIRLPATVTVGSGGSSFTPIPQNPADAAAGFTARINDTTKATTSGSAQALDPDGMNNRAPYLELPIPEHAFWVANAQALVFRLNTTPADSILLSGSARVREFG